MDLVQFEFNNHLSVPRMDFDQPGWRKRRGTIDNWMGGRNDLVNLVVILPVALLRGGWWNAKRMQLDGMQIIVLLHSTNYRPSTWRTTLP